jgi:hypothetical protein
MAEMSRASPPGRNSGPCVVAEPRAAIDWARWVVTRCRIVTERCGPEISPDVESAAALNMSAAGNGLRAVPQRVEQYGARSLQRPERYPDLNPARFARYRRDCTIHSVTGEGADFYISFCATGVFSLGVLGKRYCGDVGNECGSVGRSSAYPHLAVYRRWFLCLYLSHSMVLAPCSQVAS